MKTAILFGSSGLIGNELLNIFLNDDYYSKIKIFIRGEKLIDHKKIEIIKTDFINLTDLKKLQPTL